MSPASGGSGCSASTPPTVPAGRRRVARRADRRRGPRPGPQRRGEVRRLPRRPRRPRRRPAARRPGVLSYLVAATMVLDLADKQALLAAPDAAGRLQLELELLRREGALLRQLPCCPASSTPGSPRRPTDPRPPPRTGPLACRAGEVEADGGTPATVALTRAGVAFTPRAYAHDPAAPSYGLEAADALGVDAGAGAEDAARLGRRAAGRGRRPRERLAGPEGVGGRAGREAGRDGRPPRRRAGHRLRRRRDLAARPAQGVAHRRRRDSRWTTRRSLSRAGAGASTSSWPRPTWSG